MKLMLNEIKFNNLIKVLKKSNTHRPRLISKKKTEYGFMYELEVKNPVNLLKHSLQLQNNY